MLPKLPKLPSAGQKGCFWQHYCHPQVRAAIFFREILVNKLNKKLNKLNSQKFIKKHNFSLCLTKKFF